MYQRNHSEGKRMKKKCNSLYTTVTVSDFNDAKYINQLIKLNIGIELAFLTKLSDQLDGAQYEKDLEALKKEMAKFTHFFDTFKIPFDKVRIHQPGGYAYYWCNENKRSGFDFLKDFFSYCYQLGFRNYVIHTPYGNSEIDQDLELKGYREKLTNLVPDANVEVEEISVSNNELESHQNIRFYSGALFEKLLEGQKATMLLDTYECGGVDETINRIQYLRSKGFEIRSIHAHKDKHKFLASKEVGLLSTKFCGNLVNEGFLRAECSFDEFVKTKLLSCVVPNDQRVEILKGYKKQMGI